MSLSAQTLAAFVAAWTGKVCSVPGVPAGQCVAPVQLYATTVVGAPPFTGAAASDFFTTYSRQHYQAIDAAGHAPAPGDVVIWGGPNAAEGTSALGHCGICVAVRQGQGGFTSLDQNWPEGSACHLQTHDYGAVRGYLRPLPPPTPPPASARIAVAVLAAHAAALTKSESVAATNALVAAIATWPRFTD